MRTGRPSDYTPQLVEKAWEYANGGWKTVGDRIPSIAGLACEIGVRRETCHAWAKDDSKDFSNILAQIAQMQERTLLNRGLDGDFNPSIAKMVLTKHGYSDKVDNVSSDGSMTPQVVQYALPDNGRDKKE